jgi:hypothetical protein
MQRAGKSGTGIDDEPLALDLQRLIRQVALWASGRPIVLDIALFGDRIRSGRKPAVLELAVRFDENRMVEGFDDWIEQLRTNFHELETLLGERVSVVPPENTAACSRIFAGRDLQALASGKVRVIASIGDDEASPREAIARRSRFDRTSGSSLVAAARNWLSIRSAGAH